MILSIACIRGIKAGGIIGYSGKEKALAEDREIFVAKKREANWRSQKELGRDAKQGITIAEPRKLGGSRVKEERKTPLKED